MLRALEALNNCATIFMLVACPCCVERAHEVALAPCGVRLSDNSASGNQLLALETLVLENRMACGQQVLAVRRRVERAAGSQNVS